MIAITSRTVHCDLMRRTVISFRDDTAIFMMIAIDNGYGGRRLWISCEWSVFLLLLIDDLCRFCQL